MLVRLLCRRLIRGVRCPRLGRRRRPRQQAAPAAPTSTTPKTSTSTSRRNGAPPSSPSQPTTSRRSRLGIVYALMLSLGGASSRLVRQLRRRRRRRLRIRWMRTCMRSLRRRLRHYLLGRLTKTRTMWHQEFARHLMLFIRRRLSQENTSSHPSPVRSSRARRTSQTH